MARSTRRRQVEGRKTAGRPRRIGLGTALDLHPNPDSRVTLSPDRRDALGMPLARPDWRVTPEDARSVVESTKLFAAEMARPGFGRVRLYPAV